MVMAGRRFAHLDVAGEREGGNGIGKRSAYLLVKWNICACLFY
jgi:hypothetical protein